MFIENNHNIILPKYLVFVKKLGSSFDITRARVGGASVIPLLSSLLFSVPPSIRRKVLGAKPKQAGKKEGGWGEGIFARSCLPFPFRLRKGKAEGGFGGNSAFPLRNQIEASPATYPNTWRAEHRRKILFSFKKEKIGRAQNEKSKEYFSAVWRACRAVAGLASLLGVLLKKSSNINQKTPPNDSPELSHTVRKALILKDFSCFMVDNSRIQKPVEQQT